MTIHHATLKRAEKAGIILTETGADDPNKKIEAHWPKVNHRIFGADAKEVLAQMLEFQDNYQEDDSGDEPSHIEELEGDEPNEPEVDPPFQGRSTDNEESDEEESDEEGEADEESDEEEDERSGSVVADRYRVKYKELGHPTHCGDWLATTLINLCTNKEGINTELFEVICAANGVDLSKYRHTGHGWQGRLRMTGRNLLARVVYFREGKLLMPDTINGGEAMQAPADWMATRKFKAPKPKKAADAQPEAEKAAA